MAKLIKRKQSSITEKFRLASKIKSDKLSLNKESEAEEFVKKILISNLAPIIHLYYIDSPPVISSKQVPYYAKAGFKKSVTMIKRAIKGTLYNDTEFRSFYDKKFTVDEILNSIYKHKLAISPEYKPIDKKFLRVSLDQFFFNPYAKSIGRSFMLYWIGVDPMPIMKTIKDDHPEITKELIRLFDWNNLNCEDMNYIIIGVAAFQELCTGVKFSPMYRMTPAKLAEVLWIILTDLFETINKSVVPKNLISHKFPKWIQEGLINSDYTL